MNSLASKSIVGVTEIFSRILRFYLNHFGLFWKVMMPLILLCFLIDVAAILYHYNFVAEPFWNVDTSGGFSVTHNLTPEANTVKWSMKYSSFIAFFLWFAMCPLVLTVYRLRRGMDVSFQDVWRQTLQRSLSIIGAFLLLIVLFIFLIFLVIAISQLITFWSDFSPFHIATVFVLCGVIVYFTVRWSLLNQCIIIEGLSVIEAYRRSYALVKGRVVSFFGRYLLLLWGSGVIIGLVFALTFLMLSTISPELEPMQEKLLSVEIYNILLGIDVSWQYKDFIVDIGKIEATLSTVPTLWVIMVILIQKIILYAVFTPMWAILTTQLYMEQTEGESNTDAV